MKMSSREAELQAEIDRLTTRVQQLENGENSEVQEATVSASADQSQRNVMTLRAKPDTFSGTETTFDDWLKHFQLCARINGWSSEQCQHQLAVRLRGRAQRVYNSIPSQDVLSYEQLQTTLRPTS